MKEHAELAASHTLDLLILGLLKVVGGLVNVADWMSRISFRLYYGGRT